jgi:hypothetical protein
MHIVSPTTGEAMATSPWLTVGREYDVLEIFAESERGVLLRIETDESGTPGLWDASLFTTVSAEIPASWSAEVQADGSLTIGPDAWRRSGFWESYFDGDPGAVSVYNDALAHLRLG